MSASNRFITATEKYNTFEENVPSYYFRRSFDTPTATNLKITIAACGFYELFFNGKKITRGFLSPYVSHPDHYVYYDEYELVSDAGENVVGFQLGNGFQNNPGGYIWGFDKAKFRSAPLASVKIEQLDCGKAQTLLETDTNFKIAPSPIRSDDYRFGEHYDANYEIDGWCDKGFDDTLWQNALEAATPKGELRIADIEPIIKTDERKPVSITPCGDGYIYDFGSSDAGICRLRIKGKKGQKISLRHAESLLPDGDVNVRGICPMKCNWEEIDSHLNHLDTYVCKGIGIEEYQPSFTFHGFRFVRVDGITPEQATEDLLTYLVYHTRLETLGDFSSSDEISTKLQAMTRRSLESNYYHFPLDCPQREKNGWTADASLSCEAALLNFNPERGYREWMRNIRKSQKPNGRLPGIVPTSSEHWYGAPNGNGANGPAWDRVLVDLPYFTYIYRGETEMIRDSADSFMLYLQLLRGFVNEKGLLRMGLGDWVHVTIHLPKAPLTLTTTVMSMDIAYKIAEMMELIGRDEDAKVAKADGDKYRQAIREHMIDLDTGLVEGSCQSCQALCLFYGVFEEDEKQRAFDRLLEFIHEADDHIDIGVLGGRVLFHVLTDFGYGDLAYKMITREDYPSFGNWIKRGATALWENFLPDRVNSMNHHFWGDISAWFIKRIAGICLNPSRHNLNEVEIHPTFITALDHATAYHIAPAGKISSSWERCNGQIRITVEIPQAMSARAVLDDGYCFEDGTQSKEISGGVYTVLKK